jgi:hypothetical protein
LLAATIESVLAQTFRDFEVVVSDDGGGVARVVEGFADERVRYHRNPAPAGAAANLATVIGLSRGRLIAILNDDDLWLPDFLATTVGVLEAHPEVGIVLTADYFDVGGRQMPRRLPYAPGRSERGLVWALEHGIPASATVTRRTVWDEGERAVPITPGVVGDVMVQLRAGAAGWPFYYVDRPLAVTTLHAQQLSWSEQGLPARMVSTYEAFRFADPVCEDLRRARVAEFLLARAHSSARAGRWRAAWHDIGRAHRASPRPLGLRALLALSGLRNATVRWGASHPAVLVSLLRLWRRVRPSVLR